MVPVPSTLDDLISTTEAATMCGISVAAVCNWRARGYLNPSGLDERGRPLYKRIDVLRTARDTRRRGIGPTRTA